MRLGIDAREIENGVFTGVGRPLANFLDYFSKLENNDECILFSTKKIPLDFGSKIRNVIIRGKFTFYWDQIKLPTALKKEKIDIFYSPYYKVPLLASCPIVSAILDLMYLSWKEYRRKLSIGARLYYMIFGRCFAYKAHRVITDSEHSKKDIVKFYKISEKKIDVIPLSVNRIYNAEKDEIKINETKQKYGINKGYILFVGNFKPHKNVRTLTFAFKKIVDKLFDLQLLLVGPKEHTYEQLRNLVEDLSLQNKVIFTGKITNLYELKNLYNGAELFVTLSLYEGFGLPAAEAMACGVPVVVSNCTSLPEVVDDAGILVEPLNIEEIASAVLNLLENQQMRNELIRKGRERAEIFSQDRIAKRTYDLFQEVFYK